MAFVPDDELTRIEGFDEEIASELKARAQAYIEEQNQKLLAKLTELGVAEDLLNSDIEGLDTETLVKLGEKDIKTLDDLADLASDELVDILGVGSMTMEEANTMIMAARAHWFEDEDSADGEGEEPAAAEETDPA